MKNTIVSLLFFIVSALCFGQYQEVETELDLLRGPVSPAAALLGISTTDIDRPTDLSSVMVSLQTATNSFSNLPLNYSLEIAPFAVLGNRTDFSTEGLQSKCFKEVFKQSLLVSLALSTPEQPDSDLKNTYLGMGFKFALVRGSYDTPTEGKLNNIIKIQDEMLEILSDNLLNFTTSKAAQIRTLMKQKESFESNTPEEQLTTNSVYLRLLADIKELENEMAEVLSGNGDGILAQKKRTLKELASDFQLERTGWSLDLNGGLALAFRKQAFDNSRIHNAGLWLNGGYTTETGFLFLGLVRYLYNPSTFLDTEITPVHLDSYSGFDTGARIIYARPQSKFSISAEAIYRSIFSNSQIDSSWKVLFNAEYALYKNQKLTLTIGKDFDGTLIKDGNLIAALTFIQGFGNKR